jgi:dihydrodipicolinate synthase/N-acetylneuraminate lyase
MPSAFSTPLSGIIPPMVTPLSGRGTLDVAGLERLVEHMLTGGVHGLFLLGTTGEGPSLSYRLRRELIDRVCAQVAGRVPVLVAITDTSLNESLALARHAAAAGAQAVVAAPPFYFPLAQSELAEYMEHLAAESPLPLYLYNMPAMTKISFEPATVRRLMQVERIAGIKDSSGDTAHFENLLALREVRADWSFLIGPEHLTAWAAGRGGHGGVNGGANLRPRLFVDLYDAAHAGQADRVARLQAEVERLGQLYCIGPHGAAVIQGLKCALAIEGICSDLMADPFCRFNGPERARVERLLAELGA